DSAPPHPPPFPTRRSSDLLDMATRRAPAGSHAKEPGPGKYAAGTGAPAAGNAVESTLTSRHRRSTPMTIVRPGSGETDAPAYARSEEHTSELQSRSDLVCR